MSIVPETAVEDQVSPVVVENPIGMALEELREAIWSVDYTNAATHQEALTLSGYIARAFVALTNERARRLDAAYPHHLQEFASYLHWGYLVGGPDHPEMQTFCLDFAGALVLDPNNPLHLKIAMAEQLDPKDFLPHLQQMIKDIVEGDPFPLIPDPLASESPTLLSPRSIEMIGLTLQYLNSRR